VHEYDIALKSVIRRLSGPVLQTLTGFAIQRWHNVELPEVRALRMDMVGETMDGTLVQLELQSTNDGDMALRMAEYALSVYRHFRQFPQQMVLYVGKAPLGMTGSFASHSLDFRFRLVDIRELDGAALLEDESTEANVIAVLMRLGDRRAAVRTILRRIAGSDPDQRQIALREFVILAGLRHLGAIIEEETRTMPILDDIMDHDLLGPALRRGMQQGLEQGLEQGRVEGRMEGEQTVVMRLIEKRFGSVPAWARQRLEAMSAGEIEETALRLLDAQSLESLLD
jgi:predicted transposase YdaD